MKRLLFSLLLFSGVVLGQGYPAKPIQLIVPFPPGGPTDIVGRMVAQKISEGVGQPVVVENRAGAGGVVGSEAVAKSPPDGHTLCMGSIASHSVNVSLIPRLPYDVLRDFTPVSLVTNAPNLLVVNPSVPAQNLQEFLAWAKAQRGGVSYASAGNGTSSHLAGELLKLRTGAPLEHVPYRSGAQMVQSIMTGEAQFGIAALASATPLMREGKVRGVAMVGGRRFPTFPDIPTLEELGVPGFENGGFFLLIGPAGLPRPVAEALNRALVAALRDPGIREKMLFAGHDPVQGPNTLEEARAFMVRELEVMREMVERTGIRIQQ